MFKLTERLDSMVGSARRFSEGAPGLLAAAIAYNVFFSLAPLALAALAVASLIGQDQTIRTEIVQTLGEIAPPDVVELIEAALDSAASALSGAETRVIVLSLLVALYTGSRATVTIQRALVRIEGISETRPFWKVRLTGILLTVAGGVAFLLALGALVSGSALVSWIEQAAGIDWLRPLWASASLPLVVVALFSYLVSVYRWGPPRPLDGSWLAALLATAGSILASLGFAWYLSNVGGLGAVVGAVATVAVLLLWLFVGGFVIVASAFVGSEMARAGGDRPAEAVAERPALGAPVREEGPARP